MRSEIYPEIKAAATDVRRGWNHRVTSETKPRAPTIHWSSSTPSAAKKLFVVTGTRTHLYFLDQAKANSKTIRDVCPHIYTSDCSIRLTSLSRSPRIGVATLAGSVSTEEWPYTFITWQIKYFGSSREFLWSIQEAREAKKEPEEEKDADRLSNKHSACRGPAP